MLWQNLTDYQKKVLHYYIMQVQPFFNNRVPEKAWTTKFKYTDLLCSLPSLRVYFAHVQILETYLGEILAEENYT